MSWASDIKDIDFSSYKYDDVKSSPHVSLVDSDENLEVFCYNDGIDESFEFEKRVRGMIFSKANKQLISVTFGYTPFFSPQDEKLQSLLKNLSDCEIFESHEGSILKLFFFSLVSDTVSDTVSDCSGKWYLSTHKKLDAFKSKRSSDKSLGEIFVNSLSNVYNKSFEEFTSDLDKNMEYIFLLENGKWNRKVCYPSGKNDTPSIFHVGTLCDLKFIFYKIQFAEYPKQLKFVNSEEMIKYIESMDPYKFEGVIITLPNQERIKIFSSKYFELSSLRGNEHSVVFRYLQIRNDPEMKEKYRNLYPFHLEFFDDFEYKLSIVVSKLHNLYMVRHVGKNFMYTSPLYHNLCKELHGWFIQQKTLETSKVVTLDVVRDLINTKDASTLLALINSA